MDFAQAKAALRRSDTKFGRIAAIDAGAGTPIVFLHGVPLHSAHWRGVIGRLAPRWRCLAPDLMGMGESEPGEGIGVDFTTQASMVLDLLDRFGVSGFHLVGNDSGGAIAQIVACRAEERLLSLTLTNCDVDEDTPPAAFAQGHELAKAGQLAAALGRLRGDLDLARAQFAIAFENPGHLTSDLLEAYLAPLVRSPARERALNAYVASIEKSHLVAIRDALGALTAPTQLIWASEDVFFPRARAEWLAKTIPGVRRLIEAPGARLFFCEERPDWVAARIEEFLNNPVSR